MLRDADEESPCRCGVLSRCPIALPRSSSQAGAAATSRDRRTQTLRIAIRVRAAVARSRTDERLRLGEPRPQPDGPARAAERGPRAREPRWRRAGHGGDGRQDRSRSACATTAAGRTATPSPAADFEYAWKRILDPKLAAGYAYQLYGIVGATEYNGCEQNCATLRDRVGVKALDERTFEVKLTSPQPWFIAQVAHVSFLPVHRADGGEVRPKLDRAGEHRHERPLPPHGLEARRVDHADEVAAVARCRRGRRSSGSQGGSSRTRRLRWPPSRRARSMRASRRPASRPDDIERLAGQRRVRPVARSRDPVPRAEPEERPGPEPAPSAGVRARPDVARRERDEGGRRAGHQLHAEGNARASTRSRRTSCRQQADLEAARDVPANERRPRSGRSTSTTPASDAPAPANRGRGAGDVEADRHRDRGCKGLECGAVLRTGSARRSTPSVDVFVLGLARRLRRRHSTSSRL